MTLDRPVYAQRSIKIICSIPIQPHFPNKWSAASRSSGFDSIYYINNGVYSMYLLSPAIVTTCWHLWRTHSSLMIRLWLDELLQQRLRRSFPYLACTELASSIKSKSRLYCNVDRVSLDFLQHYVYQRICSCVNRDTGCNTPWCLNVQRHRPGPYSYKQNMDTMGSSGINNEKLGHGSWFAMQFHLFKKMYPRW